MTSAKYDLIVIGSGPAGEKGAVQAAYFGKKVVLIEKEPMLGGAAANTGTLPSKTLRESALFLSGFRQRDLTGLHFHMKDKVTVRDFMARERIVTEGERARIAQNLKKHGITVLHGTAAFTDPHTVCIELVNGEKSYLRGDVFLIATGSHPHRPEIFPFDDHRIFDSDTILNLHEIPASMLVVGGGVIGCEYASMFAALGVQVTVVEKRQCLVGFLDAEIADSLHMQMEHLGVRILLNDSVASMQAGQALDVRLQSGVQLEPQAILVSAGRAGNTQGLGLDRIGIAVRDRGRIPVNDHYQTAVPHIYAAGDVIGHPALASTSMEQARVAMVHAFDLKYKEGLAHILPYGVYTIPECSMAGETEESLKEKNIPYVVGKTCYAHNARGQIIGDHHGLLKLLFRTPDMKLVGVHIIGEQAAELIHIGLTAILLNAGADLFIQTCFNYPSLSEMYKYAAYDALGRRQSL